MKTLMRTVLITGAVVLALAAVYGMLLLSPAPRETQEILFTDMEPVDIASVTVENATGTYSFYYQDDGYVLDDIPGTIVDLDAFIAFMTNCGQLKALRQVADAPLARYGLQTPSSTVDLVFFSEKTLRLTLGDQEKISGNYYVAVEGFPGVYLMEKSLAEPFLRSKTQMITRLVTPALALSSPLSAIRDITFTGGPLEEPVTIQATSGGDEETRLAALSFGTATHLVRSTGVYQLDQTYGVEVLGSLFGIPSREIAGYNLSEEEISQLGFNKPWMKVECDMVNGLDTQPEHVVLLVTRLGEDDFYATRAGSSVVYRIGRQPFMDIRYDRLLLRWFLTPMLMDVSSVTVKGDGRQYRFEVDQTDRKNPVITYEGTKLDVQLFRSLFRLLTSAAHDGVYLGRQQEPASGNLLTITYEYTDPGKATDVLSLYPGGVRRANVFVNGIGEFAMKDQFIDRVWEGCEHLITGQPVEENW
ncbi:MAG: DUF4340 domain-containing protein [Clostridiales bacterium]|nr:DUF4340 domain-containing protein [Clostridiales bacterium]